MSGRSECKAFFRIAFEISGIFKEVNGFEKPYIIYIMRLLNETHLLCINAMH